MSGSWKFKKGNPAYDRYIHSAGWRRKAGQRLEMDGHVCQVCGREAIEVHHLTYDRFGNEEMSDLVSLCRKCHNKAEELYDPSIIPWAMEEKKPEGNNFMAAMRADAAKLAPVVFEYLKEVLGEGFDGLMRLRQPEDKEGKKYWSVLKRAVDALCRKRYSRNCVEDRTDILMGTISNRVAVICMQQIEHDVRNSIQADLHDTVMMDTMRWDDGTSFGPSLREAVLYYCGLDAAAGIRPLTGFECLTAEDYGQLNALADYMVSVSGTGKFRGEERI